MSRHCPLGCKCGSNVKDVREDTISVIRRRECRKCKYRWSTWEISCSPLALSELYNANYEAIVAIAKAQGIIGSAINNLDQKFKLGAKHGAVKKPASSPVHDQGKLDANPPARNGL